jgi:hypothetical protein
MAAVLLVSALLALGVIHMRAHCIGPSWLSRYWNRQASL